MKRARVKAAMEGGKEFHGRKAKKRRARSVWWNEKCGKFTPRLSRGAGPPPIPEIQREKKENYGRYPPGEVSVSEGKRVSRRERSICAREKGEVISLWSNVRPVPSPHR